MRSRNEVFGPVALMPCSGDADEVVDIVAAGGGGLVASVYSDDRKWTKEVLLGIAPWNGRILWGSKIHEQSPDQELYCNACAARVRRVVERNGGDVA